MTNSCPAGGCEDSRALRQTLYQPPAPADIDKMRRNKMLEERAFALLKEILSTLFFFVFKKLPASNNFVRSAALTTVLSKSQRHRASSSYKSNISLKFLPKKEMFPEQ